MSREPELTQEDITEHWAIRDGLKAQAARRERGETVASAARREIGELTRRASALKGRSSQLRIDITDVASLTGLSRPTVYATAGEQPADPEGGDYPAMTDAGVAVASLQGYEGARTELHARYPELAAIATACEYLTTLDMRRNPRPVMQMLDGPPAPGVTDLRDLYDAHVKAIAAGKPVDGIDKLILTREDA